MNLKVEKLLAQLMQEDKAYLQNVRYTQKKRRINTKRLLREKEGRNRFFRRRMIKDGYVNGSYFGEGL